MWNAAYTFADRLLGLGLDAGDLGFRHMVWRAAIVFILAVLMARVGARRFLGHNAGFDIIVLVMLGSVLSRGINGEAAFFPTLGASALLVGLHHVFAVMAFNWHWFSQLVKGRAHVLVRNGAVVREEMARCKITPDDLDESLRLHGRVDATSEVREARLERNGVISVVRVGRETREVPRTGPER
jgi:uncharacterized membrane protein YcaP (DUF421 family)